MDKIGKRRNERLIFEAEIHGFRMKDQLTESEPVTISKEQRRSMETALEQALARKRMQHGR